MCAGVIPAFGASHRGRAVHCRLHHGAVTLALDDVAAVKANAPAHQLAGRRRHTEGFPPRHGPSLLDARAALGIRIFLNASLLVHLLDASAIVSDVRW